VGWLTAGTSPEDDAPTDLELMGLYITSQWYGSGVAHALIQAGIGDRDAFLWVLKDNPRAQAFYRKEGFELDGVEKYYTLGPSDVLIARMTRIREEP
jgi:ribosomal protein S18 acetylase RimI-like enzyme